MSHFWPAIVLWPAQQHMVPMVCRALLCTVPCSCTVESGRMFVNSSKYVWLLTAILNIPIIIHTRPYANHAINEKYSVINHQCKHIHYLGLKIKCSLMFKIEVFSLRKQKRVFSIKAAHLCTEVVQCSQRQAVPVVERILTCFSFFPSPQVLPCADAMDRCQNYAIS